MRRSAGLRGKHREHTLQTGGTHEDVRDHAVRVRRSRRPAEVRRLVPRRHPLRTAVDADVRVELDQLLPPRHDVGGAEAAAAHLQGLGLAAASAAAATWPCWWSPIRRRSPSARRCSASSSSPSSRTTTRSGTSTWSSCRGTTRDLRAFDIDGATNIEMLDHLEDVFRLNRRMWEIHFYFMYVVFGVYMLFEAMMKQMFDIDDSDPKFHRVLTGFDNKVFQVDKKLWSFGKKAQAMGHRRHLHEQSARPGEGPARGDRGRPALAGRLQRVPRRRRLAQPAHERVHQPHLDRRSHAGVHERAPVPAEGRRLRPRARAHPSGRRPRSGREGTPGQDPRGAAGLVHQAAASGAALGSVLRGAQPLARPVHPRHGAPGAHRLGQAAGRRRRHGPGGRRVLPDPRRDPSGGPHARVARPARRSWPTAGPSGPRGPIRRTRP